MLDDSSDPDKGAAAAKKLAADPTVVAVVGPYNSGVAQSVLPVLAKRGIALISPSNTLTSLTLGENAAEIARPFPDYFRLVGPDSLQAQFLAVQARARGFSSVAVVSETKAVSQGLADAFADAFAKGGGTVTVQQTVPDGATNFADFLAAVASAPPGLVFFGGEYQVAAALRTAATEAGVTVPLMGGDGINDAEYITGAGPAAEGTYASGVGVPLLTLPGAADFRAAYAAAGYTAAPTDYGPYAYDATNVVIAALAHTARGQAEAARGDPQAGRARRAGHRHRRHLGRDRLRPLRRHHQPALHPLPRGGHAPRLDPGLAVTSTRQEGQVGPSTALLSIVIPAPPHTSSWPPRNWWTRPWFDHHTSQSAHPGWLNPKMFGTSFHAAIHTASIRYSRGMIEIEFATSRMPEQRLL